MLESFSNESTVSLSVRVYECGARLFLGGYVAKNKSPSLELKRHSLSANGKVYASKTLLEGAVFASGAENVLCDMSHKDLGKKSPSDHSSERFHARREGGRAGGWGHSMTNRTFQEMSVFSSV